VKTARRGELLRATIPATGNTGAGAHSVIRYLAITLTFVGTLVVFVPFYPRFPSFGGQSSWVYAMNEAISRNMVFGRDVVFTSGPLAPVYTRIYHPATDPLMLGLGSFFAAAFFAAWKGLRLRISDALISQKDLKMRGPKFAKRFPCRRPTAPSTFIPTACRLSLPRAKSGRRARSFKVLQRTHPIWPSSIAPTYKVTALQIGSIFRSRRSTSVIRHLTMAQAGRNSSLDTGPANLWASTQLWKGVPGR
jgi:hypothetical protein